MPDITIINFGNKGAVLTLACKTLSHLGLRYRPAHSGPNKAAKNRPAKSRATNQCGRISIAEVQVRHSHQTLVEQIPVRHNISAQMTPALRATRVATGVEIKDTAQE